LSVSKDCALVSIEHIKHLKQVRWQGFFYWQQKTPVCANQQELANTVADVQIAVTLFGTVRGLAHGLSETAAAMYLAVSIE
jgi:hypothetical protein